ncbi:DUF502 domain-containing protein [Kistimonas asteriae]|uniref:DUF502 domain-containing protein n=1 Tax=Kistimonas asteriae TaxID=517724 RepID=UPI001BA9F9DB|nr:DUF502 domain-containing protein [Kistimonas asteriae]
MSRIMRWFLEGLVVLVPILITVYLFSAGINWVADVLSQTIGPYLSRELPIHGRWQVVFISLVLVVGVTILIGAVTHLWLGKHIVRLVDQVLTHIPLVKLVYAAIKDGVNAIIGDRREFDKPVLVAIGEMQVPGFITRHSTEDFGLENHVAVYFPMAFSIAGRVVLVSADKIRPLDNSSAEVMSFLVSGGVTSGKKTR